MPASAQVLSTLEQYPDTSLSEAEITRLWQSIVPRLEEILTVDGKRLRLLENGRVNTGSGPDLIGVKVSLDGVRKSGALEIHRQPAGWYHHGHHEDPAFNRVILHLCFAAPGKCPTRRQDGVMVPRVILEDYLEELRSITRRAGRRRLQAVKHRCYRRKVTAGHKNQIRRQLEEAGRCWLYRRAARLRQLPREKRVFQPLVAALGYTYNHRQFRAVGRRLDLDTFYGLLNSDRSALQLESWLLGRAGWFRGQFSRSINSALYRRRRCWREDWADFNSLVRVDEFWRHGKVRPQAYPCRRWLWFGRATGRLEGTWHSWLMERAETALSSGDLRGGLTEALNDLFNFPERSYWDHHYTFKDDRKETVPSPVGQAWIDQVIVNVVFPWLFCSALLAGDSERRAAVEDAFVHYPPVLGNRRNRRFLKQLGAREFEWAGVGDQQGATFVYKRFCRRGDCSSCPFARGQNLQLTFSF